jgi:hypothetical protein
VRTENDQTVFAGFASDVRAGGAWTINIPQQSIAGLWTAIGRIIDLFPPAECANYFSAAGYDTT